MLILNMYLLLAIVLGTRAARVTMAIVRNAFFSRANALSVTICRSAFSVLGVPLKVILANTPSLAIDGFTDCVVTTTDAGAHIIRWRGFTLELLARRPDTDDAGLVDTHLVTGTRVCSTVHGHTFFCNGVVFCIEGAACPGTRNAVASFDTCHSNTRRIGAVGHA